MKGVNIEFFKSIVLEGFYAEDLHHDTLISAAELKINISSIQYSQNEIHIKKLSVENASFFLKQYKEDKDINLGFLIDYFASKDTTATAPWKLSCDNVQLSNVSFKYRDENEPKQSPGVDYFDMEARQLFAEINDIRFDHYTLSAHLEHLSLKEKSGFVLNELSCDAKISDKELSFPNLHIRTFNSEVHGEYAMLFNDYSDFSDFIKKVHLKAKFENSKVAVRDIAFFATILFPVEKQFMINHAEVRGTVSNLKGKNLDLQYATRTHFIGDLSFSGLPEFDETYIDLLVKDLKSSYSDLKTLPSYPFVKGQTIYIPEQVAGLGNIHFNGKFTGFVNDFVAYGTLQSDLGKLVSDVNLKNDSKQNNTLYSGHIETEDFDLGKLILREKILGKIWNNRRS